ncbi:MAG: SLC13 family permease [Bacteroidia bacterium]
MEITFDQISTLSIILILIVGLYKETARPIVLFGLAASALLILGVIDSSDMLSGFSNEQVAVIILLLIISSIIQKAKLLELWLDKLFANADSYGKFIRKLLPFSALVSGFLNNTPIVAAFIPYVFSWGKRNGVAPSRVLLPLSFAAILGGTMTLIGTSTNLIVNGLAQEYGFVGFNVFDFVWVGIPVVIIGIVYMSTIGFKILPSNTDAIDSLKTSTKDYLVETKVKPGSRLIDKTVEEADLRSLNGLYLVEIVRGNRLIGPVKPTQNIREGDALIFAGNTDSIPDLLNSDFGLTLPVLKDIPQQELINMVEAVVSYNSRLVGKKVRETDFRGRFDAAIVGVQRHGERLSGKIGEMVLQTGDLLVLMTGKDFGKRINRREFNVLSRIKQIDNIDSKKAWMITLGAVLAILLAVFEVMSLFKLLLLYVAFALILKWVRPGELQRSLDLNLAFIAALSLAIGLAMEKSGSALLIANGLSTVMGGFGPVGVLIGIYLLTNLLTEFITNVAAATLALPIALSLSNAMGLQAEPFIFTVAYAASFSFLSPIGYQTNLMVYGPGGYKFSDYLKFGFPLTLICFVLTIVILAYKYDLWL